LSTNECGGSIYQYVGDEGVIYWEKDDALENMNCISVFFVFQDIIENKRDYYVHRYGEIPKFKAGTNFGRVMVAEVGHLKKEIAFHGDTINIAARIRSLCHQYNADFIISDSLHEALPSDSRYQFESLGFAELKGKEHKVEIYSISKTSNAG